MHRNEIIALKQMVLRSIKRNAGIGEITYSTICKVFLHQNATMCDSLMSSAYARTPPGREGTATKGSESLTLSESINLVLPQFS